MVHGAPSVTTPGISGMLRFDSYVHMYVCNTSTVHVCVPLKSSCL